MEKRNSHFVLVHGACHGAWCWYKVAALLKAAGHKVTPVDLAASGVHPKQVEELRSFSDCFVPLMELLSSLSPDHRVILVGHSMGGLSISVAMERFPEKISASVFASAFMYGPDVSLTTVRDKYDKGLDSYMDSLFTFSDGPSNPPTTLLSGPKLLSAKLYQLSPPEDLMLATMLVRPSRLPTDEEMVDDLVVTKEKYGFVPRVYIVCDKDNIIKEDLQRWMISNSPTDDVMVIHGSDHMVMMSKPVQLCSCSSRSQRNSFEFYSVIKKLL